MLVRGLLSSHGRLEISLLPLLQAFAAGEPSRKGRNSPLGTMSFAPGRPGAKKSKEQAKKDKDFAEAKLRMLERAEKNLGTLRMRLTRKSRTHARACVPVCV